MLTLIGVVIVILGFALRFNPLLVVTVAGLATGLAGHLSLTKILSTFGDAFVTNRYMSLFILTLPVIGLLERYGLKEKSQEMIRRLRAATTGRLLIVYLFIRELCAALGLTSLGGHAQMVRPLVAPMAEGAAEAKHGELPESTKNKIKAYAASADNVGLFFGEDIFVAIGAIVLMQGFFDQQGIHMEPLQMAVWGIPTAICAFLIHSVRLLMLDKKIKREVEAGASTSAQTANTSAKGGKQA